jgi:hypothetical protein
MMQLDLIRDGIAYWVNVSNVVKEAVSLVDDETGSPPYHLKRSEKEIEQIILTHLKELERLENAAVKEPNE